jgi:diacylglycerol kinase family enzyme
MALILAMKVRPYSGTLIAGEMRYEGATVLMAVGNGRQSGGGVHVTPRAVIDDGLFDVLVVPDHDHARFAHLLTDLAQLKYMDSPHFHYLRLSRFVVESDEELQFNLDGEPHRGRMFQFEVVPKALELILPSDCPLLTS